MVEINFSVDDVIGAFCWLERTNAQTIYESFVFNVLRDIHIRYGIKIDAYCIVKNNDKSLYNVSDKWIDEFKEAESWLRFGFHSYDMNSNYNNSFGEEILNEYRTFENEIKRITGHEKCSDMVRLHYFSGNRDVMYCLRKCGIKTFLTADDDRVSYGLDENAINSLNSCGKWRDDNDDIEYIKTDFRIEHVLDKSSQEIINSLVNKNPVNFFTHESFLNNDDIISKIYDFIDELKKYNYR